MSAEAVAQGHVVDSETGEVVNLPAVRDRESVHDVVSRLSTDEALADQQALMEAYDKACRALIGPNDVQEEGGREFKKKSAWRKLARHFAISTEVMDSETWWEKNEWDDAPHCISRARVRATAPWGQYMEAVGKCSTREKRFRLRDGRPNENARAKADHDCEATAQTRASNRAVSDLIAAGEVSAEEMEGADFNSGGSGEAPTLDSICPFKKHKGEPWSEVLEEDPDYVDWILDNIDDLDADLRKLLEGARNGGGEGHNLGEEATEKVKARYFALLAELFPVPRIREQARKAYQRADPKLPDSCTEWSGLHYSRAAGKVEDRGRDLFLGAATSLKDKDPASESIQNQVKELIDKCDLSAEEAGAAWEVLETGYRPLVKSLRDHLDVTRTKKMMGHEDPEPDEETDEGASEDPEKEPVAAGDIEDVDDELPF